MHTIRHDVPMVSQTTSPVCWLACAAMIIQYRRRYTPTAAELGQRFGDFRMQSTPAEPHAAGGARQIAELRRLGFEVARCTDLARNRVRAPTMAGGRRDETDIPGTGPSAELLHGVLADHGPFILLHNAGAFSYGPGLAPPRPGSGHAVVVTGINPARGIVYFNNPWGQRDVATSISSILGAIRRWETNGANRALAWLA